MEGSGVQKSTVCGTGNLMPMTKPVGLISSGTWKPGVPSDTAVRAKPKRLFLILFQLYRRSVVPILLEEIHSLLGRIQVAREIQREMWSGLPTIPTKLEPFAIRGPRRYRHAYSESMRRLESEFPRLPTVDRLIATRMWSDGTRWAEYSSCISQNPDQGCSSASPVAGNSMPLPEAQQSLSGPAAIGEINGNE
jgi:hypothetical protein